MKTFIAIEADVTPQVSRITNGSRTVEEEMLNFKSSNTWSSADQLKIYFFADTAYCLDFIKYTIDAYKPPKGKYYQFMFRPVKPIPTMNS